MVAARHHHPSYIRHTPAPLCSSRDLFVPRHVRRLQRWPVRAYGLTPSPRGPGCRAAHDVRAATPNIWCSGELFMLSLFIVGASIAQCHGVEFLLIVFIEFCWPSGERAVGVSTACGWATTRYGSCSAYWGAVSTLAWEAGSVRAAGGCLGSGVMPWHPGVFGLRVRRTCTARPAGVALEVLAVGPNPALWRQGGQPVAERWPHRLQPQQRRHQRARPGRLGLERSECTGVQSRWLRSVMTRVSNGQTKLHHTRVAQLAGGGPGGEGYAEAAVVRAWHQLRRGRWGRTRVAARGSGGASSPCATCGWVEWCRPVDAQPSTAQPAAQSQVPVQTARAPFPKRGILCLMLIL